ncbi:hypothetical protein TR74_20100 [Carbonactinospora thermoautotrophica]|uniref:Uncharacterized protein n=1 Tax=Carbonactinospora thermoautotrophica TaxID=1469144 RepID=A0A132NA67_9ACTN|nr:hypothetical protein TR74_20100 [Carbonactinospora thermoautotrophica]
MTITAPIAAPAGTEASRKPLRPRDPCCCAYSSATASGATSTYAMPQANGTNARRTGSEKIIRTAWPMSETSVLAPIFPGRGALRRTTWVATSSPETRKDSPSIDSASTGWVSEVSRPPETRPITWLVWLSVWDSPCTARNRCWSGRMSGSMACRAARNGTPKISLRTSSPNSAASGASSQAATVSTATIPARARSHSSITLLRDSRSAKGVRSGVPNSGGTNAIANVSAESSAESARTRTRVATATRVKLSPMSLVACARRTPRISRWSRSSRKPTPALLVTVIL